jgi:hypothetical protein
MERELTEITTSTNKYLFVDERLYNPASRTRCPHSSRRREPISRGFSIREQRDSTFHHVKNFAQNFDNRFLYVRQERFRLRES